MSVENARTHLHGKRRLRFENSKRGDPNLVAGDGDNPSDLNRPVFDVIILHQRAGVEEIPCQLVFPALCRDNVGHGARYNGKPASDLVKRGSAW